MKDMEKPYLVITAENAWSRQASAEVFDAVPVDEKEMHALADAVAPYVPSVRVRGV